MNDLRTHARSLTLEVRDYSTKAGGPNAGKGPGLFWAEVVLSFPSARMPVVLIGDGKNLCGLRFGSPADHSVWLSGKDPDPDALSAASAQLQAYAAGELTRFDLPIRLSGTRFQTDVWSALLAIPYGHTVSYGRLADAVGRPGSARAVGAAVGANPVGIVVPCHRVIGASGSLTGFAGGLDNKMALLQREGVTGL